MKKLITIFMTMIALAMSLQISVADAEHGRASKKGLSDKFFQKAHFMMKHQEELHLSDAQIKTIRDLKTTTKKMLIEKQAQVDVIAVDIKSKLYDYPVDVASIEPLIEQKYTIKKEKAKALVASFARLKSILTEDQYEEMKDIWRSQK